MAVILIFKNSAFRQNLVQIFLLFLCAAALYFPVSQFEFINYDDQQYIVNDAILKQLSITNLKIIIFEPYLAAWYPLTRLSHAFEYALFGDYAGGTHLVNVLLHILNAAILLQVLLRLGRLAYPDERSASVVLYPAIIVSVLFVVHPQHVEAVAWAVQRKELLATFFALLSVMMYLKDKLLVAGVFVVMAMLSKASAVVVPTFFILLDIALIQPNGPKFRQLMQVIWSNRWMLVITLVFVVVTYINHDALDALFFGDEFSLLTRIHLYADNSLHGLFNFLILQSELFHQPISDYIIDGSFVVWCSLVFDLILLAGCAAGLFMGKPQVRFVAMGILFFFIALLPVGGLVFFGNYAFGDRYMYLSSIGIYVSLFVLIVELFRKYSRKKTRRGVLLFSVGVLLAAFLQSYLVLPKWASAETLWTYDIQRKPDSVFANEQLGSDYFFKGQNQRAIPLFVTAINSQSNRFMTGTRTASALYLAEIFCDAGEENNAIGVLSHIPVFGGDISAVEDLLNSLHYTGYESCAQTISSWYESRGKPE